MPHTISLIVAVDENNAIGLNGGMLTHLPNDLRYFKNTTLNHPVIMGRKTFDSLPKGALPNRRNIVITRNKDLQLKDCEICNSLEEALALCENENVFIMGGGEIYKQAISMANHVYLTRIYHQFNNADTYFPKLSEIEWEEAWSEKHEADEKHKYAYAFLRYDKIAD